LTTGIHGILQICSHYTNSPPVDVLRTGVIMIF
jgi:hypothetical protein